MSSNVHVLPVVKKPRRRTAALGRSRAEVLQVADYVRPSAVQQTPDQRLAKAEVALRKLASCLLDSIVAARELRDAIRS
jgi:hypothetical protein